MDSTAPLRTASPFPLALYLPFLLLLANPLSLRLHASAFPLFPNASHGFLAFYAEPPGPPGPLLPSCPHLTKASREDSV